jgi:hypothetical protein
METLIRIFGPPHEALHVLALWLIGRRAVAYTRTFVDIPDDLTTGQYVFVAGLPALVFWTAAAFGAIGLIQARNLLQLGVSFVVMMVATLAGFGTFGDIMLIIARLTEQHPPEDL